MDIIAQLRRKAASSLKTVALPEYKDSRTVEALRIIEKEGFARAILLTEDRIVKGDRERYIEEFYGLYKNKMQDRSEVEKLFADPLYYAAMMVREGKADGFVAGAAHTTSDVARAAIRCIGVQERIGIACSCFIMSVPDCAYGMEGNFIFADCGVIPDPSPRQLACIAVASAELGEKVLGIKPRVAFLSYSTKGSAKGKNIDKVVEGLRIAKEMSPGMIIDGELQVDAAIVPDVARIKYPDSPVGGAANVLIFPDLESGNIAYKLTERLAKARALGPLLMGLNKPCSDLSRGCSAEDIADCTAVTAIRAQ